MLNQPSRRDNIRQLAQASGLLAVGRGFAAQVTPKTEAFNFSGIFQVPTVNSARLASLTSSARSLYFVEQSPLEVVRTDLAGRHEGTTRPTSIVGQLVVGDKGYLYGLKRAKDGTKVIVEIETGGLTRREFPNRHSIDRLTSANGALVGWTNGRLVFGPEKADGGLLIQTPVNQSSYLFVGPNGQVVGVGAESPAMWIWNLSGTLVQQTPLLAAEFNDVSHESKQPGVKLLRITSVALGNSSTFYCVVSPYKRDEGGVVLEFDMGGKLKRRLKLSLPTIPNSSERMPMGYIAFASNTLYMAPTAGRICAYYNLS